MPEIPSEDIRDQAARLLSAPIHFPSEFKKWMDDFVSVNVPMIPFSHIFGAHINIARSGDFVATSESNATTGWKDLATIGPQILHLADGKYIVGYGCNARNDMSPAFNGGTPSDDDEITANESAPSGGRMIIKSLNSNNDNSIILKYRGSSAFSRRWLFCVRLGAP